MLHRNAPISHPISTFPYRLQVIEEIEILTSSPLLQRYNHVWQNAHWFEGVQTIYPASNSGEAHWRVKDCPSAERLDGAKSMQESLLMYTFETSGNALPRSRPSTRPSFSSNKSSNLLGSPNESVAILDICSRLLDVAKTGTEMRATRNDFQARTSA